MNQLGAAAAAGDGSKGFKGIVAGNVNFHLNQINFNPRHLYVNKL